MSFPVDARYEVRVAGTTTVKKAWADAVDDALNGLYGGSTTALSLARLFVDGVGGADATALDAGEARIDGATGDTSKRLTLTRIPTNYLLWQECKATANYSSRIYLSTTGWVRTVNAKWISATSKWHQEDGTLRSVIERLHGEADGWKVQGKPSGAADWADGAWVDAFTFTPGSGNLVLGGTAQATAVTATTGDVTATAGDVVATAGDVKATAGQLIATGTVSGNTGPGLVLAARIHPNGTALDTADFSTNGGFGATVGISVGGTDTAFTVTFTAQGGGYANPATWTLNFTDGTWTNSAVPMVTLMNTSEVAALGSAISWTISATQLTVTLYHLPNATDTYQFAVNMFGR